MIFHAILIKLYVINVESKIKRNLKIERNLKCRYLHYLNGNGFWKNKN